MLQAVDLSKPVDKRSYSKEEVPTCHDFSSCSIGGGGGGGGVTLAVGLMSGQVELLDPVTKETTKCYNSGEVRAPILPYPGVMFICIIICTMSSLATVEK